LKKPQNTIAIILVRIKSRLTIKNSINNCIIGIIFALLVGIVMDLLSRIIPIYNVYGKWIIIVTLAFIATLSYSIITAPSLHKTAEIVDSYGLKERVSTTLEYQDSDSPYKNALIQDTIETLSKFNYKKSITLFPNKKTLIILLSLTFAFIVAYFIPNPKKALAEEKHTLKQYQKEKEKEIKEAEKKINEDMKLTEEQKKELQASLAQLKKEIKEAQEKKEVDKAIEKTAKKLELKKQEELAKDLKNLEDILEKNKNTKELSAALKNSDVNKMKEELEALKNKLKDMSDKEKEELKETLAKASDSVNSSELKNQINSLSSAMTSGDEVAINQSVDSIQGTLMDGISQQQMNNALAQLQDALVASQKGNGTQLAQGDGDNQGNGQGNGQGNNKENSKGSGQSNDLGGGAGNGSSDADGGVTDYSSGSGIANNQGGSSREKEYEKIFTPKRIEGTGESSSLTGKKGSNSGNSESYITDDSNAVLGELVPYDQVAGEYSDKAMESLNSYEIPEGMIEIIKEYFSSLQE